MIMLSTPAAGAQKWQGATLKRIKCRLLRDEGVMGMAAPRLMILGQWRLRMTGKAGYDHNLWRGPGFCQLLVACMRGCTWVVGDG
jgi:hypothetical protein